MELFKSLEKRTKLFSDPFKHFEINQPLTQNAIDEICSAEIADPRKQNLNYDGTRALDGGEGAFRAGIKDGGKAKKLRCYVTKENSSLFPNLTKFIEELRSPEVYKKIDKNAYLSALAISNYIVVTCDSTSMISEAAMTGKPVYIAMMKSFKPTGSFKKFYSQLKDLGITRELEDRVESWSYNKLNEVTRISPIVKTKVKKNGII